MAKRYVARYGLMRHVGEFSARANEEFRRGDQVILRSHRGAEWGEVLCEATDRTRDYLGKGDANGRILRPVTPEDERTRDEIRLKEQSLFSTAQTLASEHLAALRLVDVEQLFGGEKLILYFVSEQRIDFRDYVKLLARQQQARIEMRQVGIRDEAKLLGDYGDCGKPLCCNTHLTEMPPVSMKMAKVQKATLDPNKISGRCGRLKCCLRYEYDTYEEYQKELPKVGKTVVTRQGQGRVLAQEILARKLLVSFEDNRRLLIDANDVITVIGGRSGKPESPLSNASEGIDAKA